MARVQIPVVTPSPFGSTAVPTPTAADAVEDHYFENDGRTLLYAITGTAAAQDVTIVSVASQENGRTGNIVGTVGNNEVRVFGPFPKDGFNQRVAGELGRVHVDITDATGLSFIAVRLPRS